MLILETHKEDWKSEYLESFLTTRVIVSFGRFFLVQFKESALVLPRDMHSSMKCLTYEVILWKGWMTAHSTIDELLNEGHPPAVELCTRKPKKGF